MVENPNCNYLLVITTNQYAGNFERELTAYLTGCIGECEVGHQAAEDYNAQGDVTDGLFCELAYCHDDHGVSRPCTIWKSDNGKYESVAIFFNDKPLTAEVTMIKKRLKTYHEYRLAQPRHINDRVEEIGIVGIELLKVKTTYQCLNTWPVNA